MKLSKTACGWLLAATLLLGPVDSDAQEASPALRIDAVIALPEQPHRRDPDVIWFDAFESDETWKRYAEKSGTRDSQIGCGGSTASLRMDYPKGSRGIGGVKVFFGDSPTGGAQRLRTDERFDDVYWRMYVRHQAGWQGGGPAKLSRATSMTSPQWSQAMIAHVWSSGESLTLDPATGVRDGEVVTRRYNDFERLKWLGNRPVSPLKIHSTAESGWWVCVESRAKLNTPGMHDGLAQLWIDGQLQCERRDLDWRGSYDKHQINAVFVEAYWNEGSPTDQHRWIDDLVISTRPIGPLVVSTNPTLLRTPQQDVRSWQVEIATHDPSQQVIWRSHSIDDSDRVTVNAQAGEFAGPLKDSSELAGDATYLARIRRAADPAWSPWHQAFRTVSLP